MDASGVLRGSRIGRITPDGQISEFPISTAETKADAITTGPDKNLWFVDWGGTPNSPSNAGVGRVSTGGSVTFPVPSIQTSDLVALDGVAVGSDGNLWFTGQGSANGIILRVTP